MDTHDTDNFPKYGQGGVSSGYDGYTPDANTPNAPFSGNSGRIGFGNDIPSNTNSTFNNVSFGNSEYTDYHDDENVDEEYDGEEAEEEDDDSDSSENSATVITTGRFGNSASKDNVIRMPVSRKKPIIIICIILVIAAVGFAFYYQHRSFTKYEVVSSQDRADEGTMEYLQFQGGFVKYNADSITYEDKTGTIVWTEAFNMATPKVSICGEYVAVADIGNNEYTLYNTSKKVKTVTTDYPISDIQVANQGMVAVVLEDEKINYISAFDSEGDSILDIKTSIDKNGYPMSIALSNDGTKLVASYVTLDKTDIMSTLTFYNFGDVGQNEVDRQVGYKEFSQELFPRICFADNDTVVAYGDQRLLIYDMKQKPKEVLNEELDENVKSVFYNANYVGYIKRTEGTASDDADSENGDTEGITDTDSGNNASTYEKLNIVAYKLSGTEALNQTINYYYTKVHATDDELILVGNGDCRIYSYNGTLKYSGDFEDGIVDLFPTSSKNQYELITSDKSEVIHLK